MKYWIRERSFVEKHNKNGSKIFQIDLVFAESNRIESNLELWLSRLWTSVWTEVSTKPLSKSGSRGRVGHKARSRENLRMAFLEASPLGSRITSRIAVIISRGRGSECGAGFGGGVTNNSAHETLPPAPSPPSYRRPSDRQEPRTVQLFRRKTRPRLSSRYSPRLRFKKVNQIDNEATIATRDSISNNSRIFRKRITPRDIYRSRNSFNG